MKGKNMGKWKFDKRSYIHAAEDLHYPDSVVKKLREAKTERECERIMTNARKGVY